MGAMSRRNFLELSSRAVGAAALGAPLANGFQAEGMPGIESARIFTVFFSTAPSRDDTDFEPITNEEIIRKLGAACRGVEFVVRDLTQGIRLEAVLNELAEAKRQHYDGVIVCGWPRDYELLRTGLPTINVAVLNDFMNHPYPLYRQNRVIDAFLDPWRFCADAAVSEQMFNDLVDKVSLIRTLKRMKGERILTVTDSEYVNVTYGDHLKYMPADYNETFVAAIDESFGTKVTKISTREVVEDKDIQHLWRDGSQEASDIARRWIRDAEKMTHTTEQEVERSARVYLAMRVLMQKYDATAMTFHIRTLTKDPRPEDLVYPALATSEFQLDNIVAKCQSHLNIVLSEMLLQYAYGRPSMLGDYAVDPYNNTSMVQHCEGPWNPWGDERRVPYILTDHRERRIRERTATGVGAAGFAVKAAVPRSDLPTVVPRIKAAGGSDIVVTRLAQIVA